MKRLQWMGALAGLQLADLATTYWALDRGAHETNPVVVWLGFPLAAAVKLGLVALIALGAEHYAARFDNVIRFAVVMYLAVVGVNVIAATGAA